MNSITLEINWRKSERIAQFVTLESVAGRFQMT